MTTARRAVPRRRRRGSQHGGNALSAFSVWLPVLFLPSCLAQQNYTIEPETIPFGTRNEWCKAQLSTCTLICDQELEMPSDDNFCDSETLDYACHCSTWDPPMDIFRGTIPNFTCSKAKQNCINDNIGNTSEQQKCINLLVCGDIEPTPGAGKDGSMSTSTSWFSTFSTSTSTTDSGGGLNAKQTDPSSTPSPPSPGQDSELIQQERPKNRGGLSSGAKAGIGVGVTIGVIAIVFGIWMWWSSRRKSRIAAATGLDEKGAMEYRKPELDGRELENGGWVPGLNELEEPGPRELHGVCVPVELDANSGACEKGEEVVGVHQEPRGDDNNQGADVVGQGDGDNSTRRVQ